MFLLSKSSVLICLFLVLSRVGGKGTTPTDKEIENMTRPISIDDISLYVTEGFRPKVHSWAKHAVSIRAGSPRKFFGDNHICGGTIISNNVVLTAAHCVLDQRGVKRYPHLLVVAGSPRLYDTEITIKSYKTKKEIVSQTFSYGTMRGDFAVLITEKNIDEDGLTIQRIPLVDEKPKAGLKCSAVGWGRIFPRGPHPDEIVYVNLTIMRRLKCLKYFNMNPSIICAGDDNDFTKGVWKGDSGGPLICNGKLTGVVSFGTAGAEFGYFASVYEYRDWILHAANLSSKYEVLFWLFLIHIF